MSPDALLALVLACAPEIHPTTMLRVIAVESSGNPLALNINRGGPAVRAHSVAEGVRLAEDAIARGKSVDIGLAQINSRNLPWLGLSLTEAFEPCTNVRAGALILRQNFERARDGGSSPGAALGQALSAYNTGDFARGFANGYVQRFEAQARTPSPSLTPSFRAAIGAARVASPTAYRRTPMNAIASLPEPRLSTSAADADVPGVQIVHSPDDADAAGAFHERALTADEAWAASVTAEPDHE